MGQVTDIDRPNAWFRVKENMDRFGGVENWFKAKDNERIRNALQGISNIIAMIEAGQITIVNDRTRDKIQTGRNYIDKNLLRFSREHRDTQFICVLPPYSRMRAALLVKQDKASFEILKATIKYLVMKTAEYDNLKIFGWDNQAFVDDIANYKDLSHCHPAINSWMLRAI